MNILNPRRDFNITVGGYAFFGLIPLPKDELAIDLAVARRIQGMPLQSIPQTTYNYTVMVETLNIAIRNKPDNLQEMKDWMDHPDPDFVSDVFEQYAIKKSEFFASLKKNNNDGSTGNPGGPGNPSGSVSAEQVSNATQQPVHGQPVPGTEVVSNSGGHANGRPPGTPQARPRPVANANP